MKKGGKRGGKEGHQGKGMDRLQFINDAELVQKLNVVMWADLMAVKGEISEVRQVQDIPELVVR
ncbi:MAG: hypothetical protein IPJ13_26605 [Saprospiraceae bacterium]|nr:hypothetical protein [Saprospiraceae bacterium]